MVKCLSFAARKPELHFIALYLSLTFPSMPSTSIAVLPFRNLSQDANNEYLSDGITEEIIHALTRVEGLKVTSRRSSFFFKGKDLPLSEIAAELKVEVILEGSVRLAADMLRVSAQLIQVEEDAHFWSESWDRKLANIFEIQDEISLLIADRLREQFGHLEYADHLAIPATQNLSAYEHELKARFHFNKWNAKDCALAIDHWLKAIDLDPNLAHAHVGLADAYGFMATTQALPYEEAWPKAIQHTHQALAIDERSAGAYYQMANIAFFTEFDFQASFKHALQAVACDPAYPEALQFMSFMHMLYGSMKIARQFLDRALERDPLNQETLFYQAYYLYRQGDYGASEKLLLSLLERNPENLPALVTISYVQLKMAKTEAVLQRVRSKGDLKITPGDALGLECLALLFSGHPDFDSRFEQLKAEVEDPMAFQQHIYYFHCLVNLGEAEEAYAWLDRCIEMKSAIIQLAFSDPLVEDLREEMQYSIYHHRIYGPLIRMQDPEAKAKLLEAETEALYREKLLSLMVEEEPYLNPQLSLRSLGTQLDIHPNQLSWLLNESFGKNFNEFINGYRIQHFKRLALDAANAHISLLGLAFESGFNSKTVFNTSFKKETGLTPKAFVNQHKA